MEVKILEYGSEIVEFFNAETLRAIDYGVLDLSAIRNYELKEVLYFCEELLASELELNYMKNSTGIFRVSKDKDIWHYTCAGRVIEAASLHELKQLVLKHNHIWYVFDDDLARNIIGR